MLSPSVFCVRVALVLDRAVQADPDVAVSDRGIYKYCHLARRFDPLFGFVTAQDACLEGILPRCQVERIDGL